MKAEEIRAKDWFGHNISTPDTQVDLLIEIAALQAEKVELLRESVELQRIQHQEFMREVARKSALLDAFEKEQAEITKSVREDGE